MSRGGSLVNLVRTNLVTLLRTGVMELILLFFGIIILLLFLSTYKIAHRDDSSATNNKDKSSTQRQTERQVDPPVKVNWDSSQTKYSSKLSLEDARKLLKDEQFLNRMDYLLNTIPGAKLEYYYTCHRLMKRDPSPSILHTSVDFARCKGSIDFALFFLLGAIESGDEEIIEKFKKRYTTYPDLLSVIRQMEIQGARPRLEMRVYIRSQSRLWAPTTPYPPLINTFLTEADILIDSPRETIELLGKTEAEIMQEIQDILKEYFDGKRIDSYSKDDWCIKINDIDILENLKLRLKDEKPQKETLLSLIVETVKFLPEVVRFLEQYGTEVNRYGYSEKIDYSYFFY